MDTTKVPSTKVPPMENLVLSGGGVKGIAYIGVLQYMEEHGLFRDLKRVLGVSIGAISALFFAMKMSANQSKDLLLKLSGADMTEFKVDELKVDNILDFFSELSVDSGNRLHSIIRACIKVKLGNSDATFRDLHEYNPDLEMIIMGSELTRRERVYFSYKLTPDFPVWKAVAISALIPLYIKPIIHEGKLYADGGLTCNYPIDYFNNDVERTVGIVFESKDEVYENYEKLPDFIVYIKLLFRTIMYSLEYHFQKEYKDSTFIIYIEKDNTVQFDISPEVKLQLMESGYRCFEEHWKKRIHRYSLEDIDSIEVKPIVNERTNQRDEEMKEMDEIHFEIESMK